MADPFTRISSMLESARDITIEAAVSASTRLSETPTSKRPQEISKLLNSRVDREVLNGMKCVMALISRGEEGVSYFADVVKNVTSANSRVKALVLIYLLKYAEHEPDTALLLINSIQKLLGDKSPNARAALIRTLGGIKIPEIASLLVLCIKRTSSDLLPHVRAASALAIGKSYGIEGINRNQLGQILTSLLSDNLPMVVGSAIKVHFALQLQLRHAWDPIHLNFRRYTRILLDLDEWSQCALVDTLAEYCRRFLPRPEADDPDLSLFVTSLRPLIYSRSPSVIFSVCRAILQVDPSKLSEYELPALIVKLVVHESGAVRLYALQMATALAVADPKTLGKHYKKFIVFPGDSRVLATHKIRLLAELAAENVRPIAEELQYCALQTHNIDLSREAVRGLLKCTQSPEWTDRILHWCLKQITTSSAPIVAELLTLIRKLLQQKQNGGSDPQSIIRTIYKLASVQQESRLQPEARGTIVWIVGEFTEVSKNMIGPDLLRAALPTFVNAHEKVRYELLVLAAKSYLYELLAGHSVDDLNNSSIGKMFHHTMHLARYDAIFDTRDRARMLEQLLSPNNAQLAALFLQVPKPPPSLASIVYAPTVIARYLEAEAWADDSTLPPSSIRKETSILVQVTSVENSSASSVPRVSQQSSSIATRPYKLQSLDEFFGDEESELEPLDSESEGSQSESESEYESEEESSEEAGAEHNGNDSASDSSRPAVTIIDRKISPGDPAKYDSDADSNENFLRR